MLKRVATANALATIKTFSGREVAGVLSAEERVEWRRLGDALPLVKMLSEGGEGALFWSEQAAEYHFRHLSFQEALFAQALLQGGELFNSACATREKALAFLDEPFNLNTCRIGEGRLGAALAPSLGGAEWRLGGQLKPAMAAAIVPLLTGNEVVTWVDLSDNKLGPEDGVAIAEAAASMPRLLVLNLLQNKLDATSAARLAAAATQGRFSLCGIAPNQTEIELVRCFSERTWMKRQHFCMVAW